MSARGTHVRGMVEDARIPSRGSIPMTPDAYEFSGNNNEDKVIP